MDDRTVFAKSGNVMKLAINVEGDDCMRTSFYDIPSPPSWDHFRNMLAEKLNLRGKFTVKFLDEDMDEVCLGNDEELKEAIKVHRNRPEVIRLKVKEVKANENSETLAEAANPDKKTRTRAQRPACNSSAMAAYMHASRTHPMVNSEFAKVADQEDVGPPQWFSVFMEKTGEELSEKIAARAELRLINVMQEYTEPIRRASISSNESAFSKVLPKDFTAVDISSKPGELKSSTEAYRHEGMRCSGCSLEIIGSRYRCMNCVGYDLCEKCEKFLGNEHDPKHSFLKIRRTPKHTELISSLEMSRKLERRLAKDERLQKKLEAHQKKVEQMQHRIRQSCYISIPPFTKLDPSTVPDRPEPTTKYLHQRPHGSRHRRHHHHQRKHDDREEAQSESDEVNRPASPFDDKSSWDAKLLPLDVIANYPNGASVYPGDNFVKSWFFQNTGTKTWDTNIKLMNLRTSKYLQSFDKVPAPALRDGEIGLVSAFFSLSAVASEGEHESRWQFYNESKDLFFGPQISCCIKSVPPETGTDHSRQLRENTLVSLKFQMLPLDIEERLEFLRRLDTSKDMPNVVCKINPAWLPNIHRVRIEAAEITPTIKLDSANVQSSDEEDEDVVSSSQTVTSELLSKVSDLAKNANNFGNTNEEDEHSQLQAPNNTPFDVTPPASPYSGLAVTQEHILHSEAKHPTLAHVGSEDNDDDVMSASDADSSQPEDDQDAIVVAFESGGSDTDGESFVSGSELGDYVVVPLPPCFRFEKPRLVPEPIGNVSEIGSHTNVTEDAQADLSPATSDSTKRDAVSCSSIATVTESEDSDLGNSPSRTPVLAPNTQLPIVLGVDSETGTRNDFDEQMRDGQDLILESCSLMPSLQEPRRVEVEADSGENVVHAKELTTIGNSAAAENRVTPVSAPRTESLPPVIHQANTAGAQSSDSLLPHIPEPIKIAAASIYNTARHVINTLQEVQERPVPCPPTEALESGFVNDSDNNQPSLALRQLMSMGFYDRDLNQRLLRKHKGDLNETVAEIIQVTESEWYRNRH